MQVRLFIANKNVWQFGEVKKKLGKYHYQIMLDSGRMIKRHVNQLKSTLVQKPDKRVRFGPTESFDIPRIPKAAVRCQPDPQPCNLQEHPPVNPELNDQPADPERTRQELQPDYDQAQQRRPQRLRHKPNWTRDYDMEILCFN